MILMQWYADFTNSEENVMKDDAIYQVNNKQDTQYLPRNCQVLLQSDARYSYYGTKKHLKVVLYAHTPLCSYALNY